MPDAVIQYADSGIKWRHVVEAFTMGNRLQQFFIHMVRVISEQASARHEFLARIQVLLPMQIEKEIYVVEEKCVAVEIKDLGRLLKRKVWQDQKLVKGGIESQNVAVGMGFLQKRCVVSEAADMYVPPFSLGQQFIARDIEKKQPHRN